MKNKYNNSEFRQNKGVVLWLSNNECMLMDCFNTAKEVHHIDKNVQNNEITNLIPLCTSCHKFAHKGSFDFSYWRTALPVLLFQKTEMYSNNRVFESK